MMGTGARSQKVKEGVEKSTLVDGILKKRILTREVLITCSLRFIKNQKEK